MGTTIKHPVADRIKPSNVIFDIRALWRSGLSKITSDGLTQSSTGCFIAAPIWQQLASKVNRQILPLLRRRTYRVRRSCAVGRHSWPSRCGPCSTLHAPSSSSPPPAPGSCSPSATWSSWPHHHSHSTIQYDMIEDFNADSKAECDQLNLAHAARNKQNINRNMFCGTRYLSHCCGGWICV